MLCEANEKYLNYGWKYVVNVSEENTMKNRIDLDLKGYDCIYPEEFAGKTSAIFEIAATKDFILVFR